MPYAPFLQPVFDGVLESLRELEGLGVKIADDKAANTKKAAELFGEARVRGHNGLECPRLGGCI